MKRLPPIKEVMSKIMEEIPLEDRLNSVYVPLSCMNITKYIFEQNLIPCFRDELRIDATKQITRKMREAFKDYYYENNLTMTFDLQKKFESATKEIYERMLTDFYLLKLQYSQCLINIYSIPENMHSSITYTYMMYEILEIAKRTVESFAGRYSVTKGIGFEHFDKNMHEVYMLCRTLIRDIFHIPYYANITSYQIEMCYKVYQNKILTFTKSQYYES